MAKPGKNPFAKKPGMGKPTGARSPMKGGRC